MQNIYFTNIRVEEVGGVGGKSRNPIQINSEVPGPISNIYLKNVTIGNFGPVKSVINGFDAGHPASNIVFENLIIAGKPIDSLAAGDFVVKNATDIKFLPASSTVGTAASQ